MTTRAYVAQCVREVNVAWQAHPEPRPAIIGNTWPDLRVEVEFALEAGEDWRARSLAKQWRDECLEALIPKLLNSPLAA